MTKAPKFTNLQAIQSYNLKVTNLPIYKLTNLPIKNNN